MVLYPADVNEQGGASGVGALLFGPGLRLLTWGLILTITLMAFESLAIATIMPLAEADLGDLHLYGWVFSAFFLGSLMGIVVAGHLADRVHPSVPIVGGLVIFGAGLVIGGLAPSMIVLVVGRALQGMGAGALPALAYVCIGRAYPHEARPSMMALLSTAWVVPALIGPGVSGLVGEAVGWRWVFIGLVPVLVGCGSMAVAGVRRLPPPGEQDGTPSASLWGAARLALGAALLLAGLGQESWLAAVGFVAVGGAIGLNALVRLTPPGTLRARPGLPAAVLVRGTITFAFFAADAYVPLTLTSVRGLSPTAAGGVLTAGALAWTVGSWSQARLVARTGPRLLVRVGLGLVAVGVGATALVAFGSLPVVITPVTWAVAGFAMGLAYSPISLTVLARAEPGREGSATASMQLCDTLGTALGTGAAGALVALGAQRGWDEAAGLSLAFCLAMVVALLGQGVARRLPSSLAR